MLFILGIFVLFGFYFSLVLGFKLFGAIEPAYQARQVMKWVFILACVALFFDAIYVGITNR